MASLLLSRWFYRVGRFIQDNNLKENAVDGITCMSYCTNKYFINATVNQNKPKAHEIKFSIEQIFFKLSASATWAIYPASILVNRQ